MRLTKKQKAALHWLAKRDCTESHACERVVTDPRKTHRAQVRRHGFGQTLYSLKRKELIVRTWYGDGRVGPYEFTDEGRVVETTLWEKRSA
jgi:hypothetical protein